MSYLRIDHIDKIFTNGARATKVLEAVDLSVEKGQYVSIIGHSGCGKSTLLNIVAGLVTRQRRRRRAGKPSGRHARAGSRRRVPESFAAALALRL